MSETASESSAPTEPTSAPSETETPTPTEPTEPTDTSSPEDDLSTPPTNYASAEAQIAAARAAQAESQELDRFQSGDEQFYCSFGEDFIRPSCEILDAVSDAETCADSISPNVGRIELTKRGWAPFCNTDTIRQPGAPVVDPGVVVTWSAAAVECVIEEPGLTCVETDRQKGFFLGPAGYQVF